MLDVNFWLLLMALTGFFYITNAHIETVEKQVIEEINKQLKEGE